jgi:hypothetical protein
VETIQVESYIYDYLISLYLLKAVEQDRRHIGELKLSRSWDGLFRKVSLAVEQHHITVRRKLRSTGCRIVLEEVLENKHLHIMYVHRKYEYHCYLMPMVLKARCEVLLDGLLSQIFDRTFPAPVE